MKNFGTPLLTLAAPLLVLVGVLGFSQRDGTERMEAIPAVAVGAGLIISGAVGRRLRRHKLLSAIKTKN